MLERGEGDGKIVARLHITMLLSENDQLDVRYAVLALEIHRMQKEHTAGEANPGSYGKEPPSQGLHLKNLICD